MKISTWQIPLYGLAALAIVAAGFLLWNGQSVPDANAQGDETACASYLPDDAITVDEVTGWRDALDADKAAPGIKRWNRVLEAFGVDTGAGVSPMPATLAWEVANWLKNTRWDRTARTLEALEQCQNSPAPTPRPHPHQRPRPTDPDTAPRPRPHQRPRLHRHRRPRRPRPRHAHGHPRRPRPRRHPRPRRPHGHTDCVSDDLLAKVRHYYDVNQNKAPGYGKNWKRVLIAFGDVTDAQLTAFTATEAQERESKWSGWKPVREALECLETQSPPPPADPEISIAGNPNITEGGTATFTLTAIPTPTADVDVSVTVTQSGAYTSQTGALTIMMTTSGTASFTITTDDDSTDESDGSVTATLNTGTGYTVSSSAGVATVNVADNDDPPAKQTTTNRLPPNHPTVTLLTGPDITEGGQAKFTLTASPAHDWVEATIIVTQSGAYTTATGRHHMTIRPNLFNRADRKTTLVVNTIEDATDEPHGTITATLIAVEGYTMPEPRHSVTIKVSDNDDPPSQQGDTPTITILDSFATEGQDIEFKVYVTPAHSSDITLHYGTADGTAIAHDDVNDYTATSGTMTIAAETTLATITVPTTDDTNIESDDQFTIALTTSTSGVRFSNQFTVGAMAGAAVGTINNDDIGSVGRAMRLHRNDKYIPYIQSYARNYRISQYLVPQPNGKYKWGIRLRDKPPTTVTLRPVFRNTNASTDMMVLPEQYIVFNTHNWATYQDFWIERRAGETGHVPGWIDVDYDIVEFDEEWLNDFASIRILR